MSLVAAQEREASLHAIILNSALPDAWRKYRPIDEYRDLLIW